MADDREPLYLHAKYPCCGRKARAIRFGVGDLVRQCPNPKCGDSKAEPAKWIVTVHVASAEIRSKMGKMVYRCEWTRAVKGGEQGVA